MQDPGHQRRRRRRARHPGRSPRHSPPTATTCWWSRRAPTAAARAPRSASSGAPKPPPVTAGRVGRATPSSPCSRSTRRPAPRCSPRRSAASAPRPTSSSPGINPGANTGHLVVHSGTVGAALTGVGPRHPRHRGEPARGPSDDPYHWDTAARFAVAAVEWAAKPDGGPRLLNINVPNLPLDEARGRAGDRARSARRGVDRVGRRVVGRPAARLQGRGRRRARHRRRRVAGRLRVGHAADERGARAAPRRGRSGVTCCAALPVAPDSQLQTRQHAAAASRRGAHRRRPARARCATTPSGRASRRR